MATAARRIPFDEFVTDPAGVFDRVVHDNEEIIVVKEDGERAVLKALPSRKRRRRRTGPDYLAFHSAAGGWSDVDTDKLIEDIYADRRASNRPLVEL